MIDKSSSSKEVSQAVERKSAMGFVMDVIATGTIQRREKNFLVLKEKLLAIPEGIVEKDVLCKYLEEILPYEETIMALFKKNKQNGKVGNKGEFPKGFYYYIGTEPKNLIKVYAHWKEDKQFLLQNITGLSDQIYWVDRYVIDCIENVVCVNFSLSDYESKKQKSEVSIYIGYNACNEWYNSNKKESGMSWLLFFVLKTKIKSLHYYYSIYFVTEIYVRNCFSTHRFPGRTNQS